MTDRGGGASLLPYTPAGMTGSDDYDRGTRCEKYGFAATSALSQLHIFVIAKTRAAFLFAATKVKLSPKTRICSDYCAVLLTGNSRAVWQGLKEHR